MSVPFTLSRLAKLTVEATLNPRNHQYADRETKELLYALTPEQTEEILDAVDAAVYDVAYGFKPCTGECDGQGVEGLCDDRLATLDNELVARGMAVAS